MEQEGEGRADFLSLFLAVMSTFSTPCTSELLVLRPSDLNCNLHYFPWFSGLWIWTKLYYKLFGISSLQMADRGTSQPPLLCKTIPDNKFIHLSYWFCFPREP